VRFRHKAPSFITAATCCANATRNAEDDPRQQAQAVIRIVQSARTASTACRKGRYPDFFPGPCGKDHPLISVPRLASWSHPRERQLEQSVPRRATAHSDDLVVDDGGAYWSPFQDRGMKFSSMTVAVCLKSTKECGYRPPFCNLCFGAGWFHGTEPIAQGLAQRLFHRQRTRTTGTSVSLRPAGPRGGPVPPCPHRGSTVERWKDADTSGPDHSAGCTV
jgi:hypothetical protein